MQLIFLYFMVCSTKILFEKEYTLIELDQNYVFEDNHGYIVQLDILSFPLNKNCFPMLELLEEEGKSLTSSYESYSQKLVQHRVWLTERDITTNSTISVYSLIENIYSNSSGNCQMLFRLTIFENVELLAQTTCKFPLYGSHCEKQINYFDIDLLIEVTVKNQSWFLAYYELNNNNYQLTVQNPNGIMGLSLVQENNINLAHQPSFFDNYILIEEKQTLTLNLNSYFDNLQTCETNIIFVGIYNENSQNDQKLILELNKIDIYEFPRWATISILFILIGGMLIALYIYYSYKRQYKKITFVKPVIEKAILNKYMPSLKITQEHLTQECSVCLIQFEKSDKFRITPCNHIFHDQCLQDWTMKNANCPICRQGLKEDEIKGFYEKINSNNNESQTEIKLQPPTQFIPLSNSDLTYQNNKSDNSPTNQLCQSQSGRQISENIIPDEVIE